MKKLWMYVRAGLAIVMVITILCLCWTAAYFVTETIYARYVWQPQELIRQIINSVLGFLFFGTVVSLISPFIRRKEQSFLQKMIDAMRRISRGDFRVNLDLGFDGRHKKNPFVQLVESINDMAANLKAMEEMRQEFISNVSHEIGSPLTSIRGFARALKNEELSREQRIRYLDIIETECVRLSKLSDNLLRLAILDSERHPFDPVLYRLDVQLQSLILSSEPQWEAKGLEMCVELDEIVIEADEDLMSQVWLNLIHNAIKFTPEGGTISIRLTHDGIQAIVSVADTGPGIAEQDQPRIFERFYKADKSRNRTIGGSGLGLSIAQKIVEMHRGTISVRSKLGEGTEFTVRLPLHI